MDIFGIGPLEIALVILVAMIFLGPKDMVKTGRTMGRWLRKIAMSPEWRAVRMITHEITTTPTRLMREAGLEEIEQMNRDLSSIDSRQPIPDKSSAKPNSTPNFDAWTRPSPEAPSAEESPSTPADQAQPDSIPPEA
jgi:sec-independent protein translocase protein TatB